MSTRHELDRSISAWLVAESQENAPDRLLAISRERIRRTPQRKPWWPAREIGQLGTKAKFNLVAGAVVAIAIIAANLLPVGGSPSVGAPAPTESPPPSPSASSQADIWETGPYDVGRHEATLDGISFTFDTPSEGWFSQDWTGMLETGTYPNVDYAWIGFRWVYDDPATDPCIGDTKSVGPSVDDLATAMSTIPGTEALEPIDARVGGLPAKVVEFTINDDIPCDPGSFWLYGPGSVYPNSLASRIKIWIFEVDGHRTGIHSDQVGSNPALEAEIQEIVDSVQFE
jgi:hypothetical protein